MQDITLYHITLLGTKLKQVIDDQCTKPSGWIRR